MHLVQHIPDGQTEAHQRKAIESVSLFRIRSRSGSILIVGASRGLGCAMAAEFLKRKWEVVGTVRGSARTDLHDLADEHQGQVEVECLDITDPDQIAALRSRLSGRSFDILFVNAGTGNKNRHESLAEVSTEEFVRVMVTNALGPMRVVEALQTLVPAKGLIGVMSSGQGSIANNEKGRNDVYRGTKAALNMYMRSYAARHAGDRRALLLMAPGWIRTELGGPDAPFGIEETVPDIVNVVMSKRGRPGLEFLDRMGKTVPW
ncbi:MAG: SDR family oxidoreductase [Alphaproteobacteria bacterium]|nr:SDR family oxidoreductase [Alphaproteobacteria bacterium]